MCSTRAECYLYTVKRKGRLIRMILLALCVAIGYILGYLRLPYVEGKLGFWMGFGACLILFLILYVGRLVWQPISNQPAALPIMDPEMIRKYKRTRRLFIALVLVVGGITWFTLHNSSNSHQHAVQQLEEAKALYEQELDSIQSRSDDAVLTLLIQTIQNSMREADTLSDSSILRIAELSRSFSPRKQVISDTLSKPISRQRGQLLILLAHSDLDSGSFRKIISNVDFSYADLSEAQFHHINLRGINLEHANLVFSTFSNCDFTGAKLNDILASGINLDSAILNEADFRRANLSWARMNHIVMNDADVKGAILDQAQLTSSTINRSVFHWASLKGALLNSSNLCETDFARSDLTRANLSNADLTNSRIAKAVILQARLKDSKMDNLEVHEGWYDAFPSWGIEGANEIMNQYQVQDTSMGEMGIRYRLKRRN